MNFKADGNEAIELLDSFSIRRLSDTEVTSFYGGPLYATRYVSPFIQDWACCGTIEEPKVLGESSQNTPKAFEELTDRLNRTVLALRTFKPGPVGYQAVELTPSEFVPLSLGRITRTFGHEYVPMGRYHLPSAEVPAFLEHARYVARRLDPALDIACSRLAQASIRTDAHDCLIDAVIGLEAILLAALGNEDYRGELRFRFALHYALLQDRPGIRAASLRIARDFYDLRSRIAHGGGVSKEAVKIGAETVTLQEASSRATEMLRDAVKRFLPDAPRLRATQPSFWEERYLGPE
jgi:hypothetical protein